MLLKILEFKREALKFTSEQVDAVESAVQLLDKLVLLHILCNFGVTVHHFVIVIRNVERVDECF